MISSFCFRTLILMRLLTLVFGVLGALPAGASPYDDLVLSARKHLEASRFKEGLDSANKAVLVNPNDYKGHYYAAMANMSLDQFEEADAAAKRSLASAPDSAKAGVEKLAAAIKDRRAVVKPNQSFIYLACSGKEIDDFENSRGEMRKERTKEFNQIYRINVTDQKIASWHGESGSWFPFQCEDPKRPPGYSQWKASASCSVRPASFDADSNRKNVDDKGEISERDISFSVSRVTGALEIFDKSTFEKIEGKKSTRWLVTNGSCTPTTEPVKKAAAVKF